MSKRYTTDELAEELVRHWFEIDCNPCRDAIIAKLRVVDKLCQAAKVLEDYQFMTRERGYELEGDLRKAIAEYEGKA